MAYINEQKGKQRVQHKKDKLVISKSFDTMPEAKKYQKELEGMIAQITSIRVDQKNINFKQVPLTGKQWAAIEESMTITCEILGDKLRPVTYTATAWDAMEEFITKGFMPRKKIKKAPNKTQCGQIRFFQDYFGKEKKLIEITQQNVQEALDAKATGMTLGARGRGQTEARPVSQKTVDNHLVGFQSFSHWCKITGKIAVRPEEGLKQTADTTPNPRPLGILTLDKLEQLDMAVVVNASKCVLKKAALYDLKPIPAHMAKRGRFNQMEVVVLFALSTGRRANEIMSMKWNHIKLDPKADRGTYSCVVKGDKIQSFPLVGKIVGVMRDMQKARKSDKVVSINKKDTDYIFSIDGKFKYNYSDAMSEIFEDAGLSEHYFHDLRDTAATMILNESKEWAVVAEVLGHEEVGELQKRYAKFFPEVKEAALRKALPSFLK